MGTFDNHGKYAESQFAFQEKHGFDVEARTCKIFGLWIAEKLGLDEATALTYAGTVVEANLDEPGFEDVLRKVRKDLDEKGVAYVDEDLYENLDEALIAAKAELSANQ